MIEENNISEEQRKEIKLFLSQLEIQTEFIDGYAMMFKIDLEKVLSQFIEWQALPTESVEKSYDKPAYCDYPKDLIGVFDCWKLRDRRGDVSREICGNCEYKKEARGEIK